MRIDIKETEEIEQIEANDLLELEHVRQTMIAMYEAQLETLKRFGFKNWSSFKNAQEKVMGAVDKPIVIDGYSLYRKDTPIIAKAGGKQIGTKSKLQITKI